MPEELITWAQFGTFPVMVALVYIVVKHTKELADRWAFVRTVGTFIYGYFWAVVFQLLFIIGCQAVNYQSVILLLINGWFIQLAAAKMSDGNVRGPGINSDGGIGG